MLAEKANCQRASAHSLERAGHPGLGVPRGELSLLPSDLLLSLPHDLTGEGGCGQDSLVSSVSFPA